MSENAGDALDGRRSRKETQIRHHKEKAGQGERQPCGYDAAVSIIRRRGQRGIVTTYAYDGVYNMTQKLVDGNGVVLDANETVLVQSSYQTESRIFSFTARLQFPIILCHEKVIGISAGA